MGSMDIRAIFEVEERIRSTFQVKGPNVSYWAEQFVDLGSFEEIFKILAGLVHEGKLRATVQIRTSENLIAWEGTAEEYQHVSIGEDNSKTTVFFTVSNLWAKHLK